jgi:GTPase
MAGPKVVFIGEVAQIAGVGAVVAGIVLSLHHWAAAAALIGGFAAFFVGKKLRAS